MNAFGGERDLGDPASTQLVANTDVSVSDSEQ